MKPFFNTLLCTTLLAACSNEPQGPLPGLDGAPDGPAQDAPALDSVLAAPDADGSAEVDGSPLLPPDPAAPGPHAVGQREDSFVLLPWGLFKIGISYPAKTAGTGATADIGGGPYPLVVFGHGHLLSKEAYQWVGQHLASWGFVTVSFSVPDSNSAMTQQWVDGFKQSVTWALKASAGSGPLAGLLDPKEVGLVGHSHGGSAALLAAAQDGRPRAVVSLSPAGYYLDQDGQVTVPVQFQVGSLDGICPSVWSESHYNSIASSVRQLLILKGANHIGFLDDGPAYDAFDQMLRSGTFADGHPTMAHDEQLRLARKYTTAWLAYHLLNDTSYGPYLFGQPAGADLSSGLLSRNQFVK